MSNLDHYLEFIQLENEQELNEITPMMALMTVPHLIKLGKFAYNKIFSKAQKACAGMPSADKNMCLRKFKLQAFTNQLRTLRSSMSKCKDTKDPNDCKDKLNGKIKTTQFKINMLNQAIRRG